MTRTLGPRPRVKISDVAEALGLTKSTVSRALNAYPDISETTRKRVRRMADQMGYRPLSHAQAIKTGRVRALGLVLEVDEFDAHAPFLATFLAGVTESASAVGWTLTVATTHSGPEMEDTLRRLVAERKADGFILPRTRVDDPRVVFLREQHVPHILYGRTGYGTPGAERGLSWYDIAGEDAMRQAVLRLTKRGHERIGFIGGAAEYNYAHLRYDGYLKGLREAGLARDDSIVVTGMRHTEDGAEASRKLLCHPLPPTALVCATDVLALGAYEAADQLGLTIGADVSVIGYDGIPRGSYVAPKLTSYHVDSRAAGSRLADLLIRQIRGEDPEALREVVDAELVQGGSDGPPARNSRGLARKVSEFLGNVSEGRNT